MPLPKPQKQEKKGDFISRCVINDTVKKDFSENKQRIAICYSQWDEAKASSLASVGNGENELLFECEKKVSASAEEELSDYKNEFLGMALGSIASIKSHAENVLRAAESDPKVKDNLTEPFLQQQLALAEDYMITVHNYAMYNKENKESSDKPESEY